MKVISNHISIFILRGSHWSKDQNFETVKRKPFRNCYEFQYCPPGCPRLEFCPRCHNQRVVQGYWKFAQSDWTSYNTMVSSHTGSRYQVCHNKIFTRVNIESQPFIVIQSYQTKAISSRFFITDQRALLLNKLRNTHSGNGRINDKT